MFRHGKSSNSEPSPDADGPNDSYDRGINLVDTTNPSESLQTSLTRVDSPNGKNITRQSTRGSVRASLNKRKYAKWQQDRFDAKQETVNESEEHASESHYAKSRTETKDHADTEDPNLEPDQPDAFVLKKEDKKKKKKNKGNNQAVIDILYENQRGAFICGIPLYSHSSLLNFDPGPWVTKDFKDSAVNITNAQVPDPSWQWDWKHWYVDMNDDVDEDGWQYSFAFFGNFAWHGTHPWFHSYVRRRRWLRRRIKKETHTAGKPAPSSMSQAHKLNTDYFTIHSKRARSPGQFPDGMSETAPRPESYVSYRSKTDFEEGIPEDIKDIATLLKALRISSIDREKIDAVKKFIESGDEELVYLKDQIPSIMSMFVFQNSKRQVLEFTKQKAKEAQEHRNQHDAEDRPEGDAESRRIDNLLNAVKAADEQIRGLEYWSDRKHVLKMSEDENASHKPLTTIFDRPAPSMQLDTDPADEIRGISKEAGVGDDNVKDYSHRVHSWKNPNTTQEIKAKNKGKGKEKETETQQEKDDEEEALDRLSPQLKPDQTLIPDK